MPFPPGPPALPQAIARPAWPATRDAGMRIADELFLVAHRDRDGRPLLPSRVMGLAVAGAVLCELGTARQCAVKDGALAVMNDMAPADELLQSVLGQLLAQPEPLPVRDWLVYLGSVTVTAVGQRLARAGVVQAHKRRRNWRFVPVDSTDAFFRAGRLAVVLDNGRQPSPAQSALIGLIYAAGLLERLPCVDPAVARNRVSAVVQSLEWPLDGLVAETTAAIDKAVITGRT